jgi:hypothetical protein
MSNDPRGYYGDEYPPPRPGEPYGSPEAAGLSGPSEAVRQRVQLPAIFLLVVAGLNLLGALYFVVNAVVATVQTPKELYDQQVKMAEMFPMLKESLGQKTPEEIKAQALLVSWPLAGVSLLGFFLPLLAGIGMLRLRWYGLSVAGSIFAAIPCVSCLGCCGVGEGIGIWSLVVLLNEEVKAAFH